MLSTSPDLQSKWSFRIEAIRQIVVKARNDQVRKVSVVDVLTNAPFPLETRKDFPQESLEVQRNYYATFKVYTLKDVKDVAADFVDFFEAVDVDQSVEDFLKAYWLYPNYIRFELVEVEPF